MERFVELLDRVRSNQLANGLLRGSLHVLIGRTIKTTEGELVSVGMTWRDLSQLLKTAKWDKDLVRELGVEPDSISPRDRERFWYSAIALARPDSPEAIAQADTFVAKIVPLGYQVGPLPSGLSNQNTTSTTSLDAEAKAKSKKKKSG